MTLKVVWMGDFYRIMRRLATRGGLVSWHRHTCDTFHDRDLADAALYRLTRDAEGKRPS